MIGWKSKNETNVKIPQAWRKPCRYVFFLNPYVDVRFTTCPKCAGKTKLKKLPLAIHVNEGGLIALNKTCRYCPGCELLIAHQNEIESHLASLFDTIAPEVVGNKYFVVGTLDRPDWKRGLTGELTVGETIQALHDFKDIIRFELTPRWVRESH